MLFAGYKVPHPLEYEFLLKIQTTPDTTPLDVLKREISNLTEEFNSLRNKFDVNLFNLMETEWSKTQTAIGYYQ